MENSSSIEVVAANAAMGSIALDELINAWKQMEDYYLELLDPVEIEASTCLSKECLAAQKTLRYFIEDPAEATNGFSSTRYERLLNWFKTALSQAPPDRFQEVEALEKRVKNIFYLGGGGGRSPNLIDILRQLYARLILDYHGQKMELSASIEPFRIGRGYANQLIVDQERVSRSHAAIDFRWGKFILTDHSTNGTYLLLDKGTHCCIRHEEFTLAEQGLICLGKADFENNPDVIRYECRYADDQQREQAKLPLLTTERE